MLPGLNLFGGGTFEARYRVYPMAFLDKPLKEEGDKVILPPSALDRLASLHVEYPMVFRVENPTTGRNTHCGVLEFVAEEGTVYLPHWMMNNLLLQVGDVAVFRNVSLPKGTYCRLQPVTSDFLDITNQKAVLEKSLRNYTCLTAGDCFVVNYNNKKYEIEVKETRPGPAISVVETDCQVDFEAPKDYKPPERVSEVNNIAEPETSKEDGQDEGAADPGTFLAFSGSAMRLDGKQVSGTGRPVPVSLSGGQRSAHPPQQETEANGGRPSTSGRGSKPGKVVFSSGNRLLDKLNKEKGTDGEAPRSQSPSTDSAPGAAAVPSSDEMGKDSKAEDSGASFKAFSGRSYSLK